MRHIESFIELFQCENIGIAEARKVETVDLFLDRVAFEKAIQHVKDMKRWVPEVEVAIWNQEEAQKIWPTPTSICSNTDIQRNSTLTVRSPAHYLMKQAGSGHIFTVSIWRNLLKNFPDALSTQTNTPVRSISVSESIHPNFPYAVQTNRGMIHARASASHLIPCLRNKIVGARAHMSAQRPGQEFPSSGGTRSWSVAHGDTFDYATQRPSSLDGRQGDLLIGGGFMRSLKQGLDQVGLYNDGATLDALTTSQPLVFFRRYSF